MNYACKELLSCRDTQLRYVYNFAGGSQGGYHEPQQSGYQEPQQSGYQEPQQSGYPEPEQQSSGYADVQSAPKLSTHGYELYKTGGNVPVPNDVHPELAAAAVSPHDAVIQIDGKSIVAPMEHIDVTKVELACDDEGCALIPDDGNPYNDVKPKSSGPAPQRGYDEPRPQPKSGYAERPAPRKPEHSGPYQPEVSKTRDPYARKESASRDLYRAPAKEIDDPYSRKESPSSRPEYRAPAKDIDGDRHIPVNTHLAKNINDYRVSTTPEAPPK